MWSDIGVVFGYAVVIASVVVVTLLVSALFILSITGGYPSPAQVKHRSAEGKQPQKRTSS